MTTSYNWLADTAIGHQIEARGEARGEARAVLGILRRRGICVSDEARDRITSCSDLELLDEWAWRAGTVSTAEELFTLP